MVSRSAARALAGAVFAALAAAAGARASPPPPPAGAASGVFGEQLAREQARLAARAGRPEAAGPLAALLALADDLPPGALEPALRRAAAPDMDPLVAAQATFQLADLVGQRGDAAAAEALRARLGLFQHYWVVGPFGDGRSSYGTTFGPEAEAAAPDLARGYPGKAHEVGWRRADAAVRDGALLLDGLLRPDSQVAAYVLAFARADRDTAAALRLGSVGPIKVWVNGALVHEHDAVRVPSLDQDAAPVRLRRGWNRILVKTVITEGAWRLFVRLTDAAGHTLTAATNEAGPPPPAPPAPSNPSAPPPPTTAGRRTGLATLDGSLRRRADRAGTGAAGAEAWLDLARYLAWAEPDDRDARQPAMALEASLARRPLLPAFLLLGDVARDEDERRRALERALPQADSAPARALVLSRLGDVARAERREAVALDKWRQALETDPGCWPAALALADEEQASGLLLSAVARLEALPPEVRAVARVRRELARLYEASGRVTEAERLLEGLARERERDVDLLHQLALRARARGDTRSAEYRLSAAGALRPDVPSLGIELARILEGAGEPERALAVLEGQAARLPDDTATISQLGKLLHRLGRNAAALERLRAAVALRPQDPDLRRYTERVAASDAGGDASGADLVRRFAADARSLLSPPSPRAARPAASADTDAAVVLLDRRVVRVHKNGLSQTFAQRLVEVRTEHGAEENKEFYVRYTPGVEEVEIRQARIWRRGPRGDLQILEATDRDDEDLSEPWYGLYYDNRAEVVRFEGLRAGDVLEIQYVVDDVSTENQMADYFGDLQFIAEGVPKRRWDYTLLAPADRPIHTNKPNLPGLERQVTTEGDERVYRFAARDVAKIETEPAMPGLAEVAPYLHVSTYASWAEVGAWYWHLVEEQLVPDDDLRRAARAVVTRGMSEEARVRAIHNLVVTGTRYVGLEFGIHGFKPYKVTQVLARRFGDCKDKASLMVALLREVGVDAELVLVRTRRGGRIDPEPASLAVFDHAIVYVPKLGAYLDGTAEFAGMAELPAQDQGVMVLRVGPHGSNLVETPVLPSSENRVARRWQVTVAADGDARVVEDLTVRGQAAADWREHYQTPGERSDRYGRVWSGRYPGARLESVEMPGLEDRNAPVTIHAEAAVPKLGQGGQGAPLSLPITVREADFARTYARLSSRREDLVIAYPWQHEEELVYRLPEGWHLQGPPVARDVIGPFGRFHLAIADEGNGVVRVRSSLDVSQYRIVPEDYPRFRAFLGQIDGTLSERLLVGPGAQAP
jgi:tetratricopeptide (TPR) repeat protein/transglutaminase-like putative cysteine protease